MVVADGVDIDGVKVEIAGVDVLTLKMGGRFEATDVISNVVVVKRPPKSKRGTVVARADTTIPVDVNVVNSVTSPDMMVLVPVMIEVTKLSVTVDSVDSPVSVAVAN